MRTRSGKEMRALMVAVSVTTLILVLAVIAYFLIDVIVTTNSNIAENKQKVVDQSVKSLTEVSDNLNNLIVKPETTQLFNQDVVMDVIVNKNWNAIYDMIGKVALGFYPIDYVGTVRGGELVSHAAKPGFEVDPDILPTEPPQGEYVILENVGGENGYYVSTFFKLPLGIVSIDETVYINMIMDRTEEVTDVETYFTDQRNALVVRLSIVSAVAVILSLLLTTLGLRYFTRKYVVKPIEELNRTAEDIAAGEFKGEVEVDEGSAYAALQGLLRSGQKVLQRFDQEMGG